MPLGFDPQRPPGMFPWLDLLEPRIPGAAYYVFGAIGGVVGYFVGLTHEAVPLPLCVALGLLVGLLFVPISIKVMAFLLCSALVAAAVLGTFWIMNNHAALTHNAPVRPAVHASPSATGRKLLDQLFQGVH